MLVIMSLVYNQLGGVFLQNDYYYVFFVPYFCMVVFSPLLFLETGKPGATVLWATIFLVCCLGVIALNDDVLGWLHRPPREALASMAVAILAALAYGFLVLSRRTGRGPAAFYMAFVLLMLVIVRPEQMGAQIWTSPRDLQFARQYQRIRQGLTLLQNLHFKKYPKFWVDTEDGPGELIAYSRSYRACLVNGPFPAIDDHLWNVVRRQFIPGDDVVIVSKEPNLRLTAGAAFAALGLVANEVADFPLASDGERYEFLVEHVSGRTEPSSEYQWLLSGDPPADAEEIKDAFDPPFVPGSN
ncbi:MAG: hypothetical protein ACRD9L_26575, partial [Bryobacteraceae bacterium]